MIAREYICVDDIVLEVCADKDDPSWIHLIPCQESKAQAAMNDDIANTILIDDLDLIFNRVIEQT